MFEQISPLTGPMVKQRWKIDYLQLQILVRTHGLKRDSKSEVNLMADDRNYAWSDHNDMRNALFRLEDVEEFERKHPELVEGVKERRLRKDQRHKERCRAVADVLWGQKPTMTIAAMAKTKEIKQIACEGKEYKVETIRGWINDLCPDRSPGRRAADR